MKLSSRVASLEARRAEREARRMTDMELQRMHDEGPAWFREATDAELEAVLRGELDSPEG